MMWLVMIIGAAMLVIGAVQAYFLVDGDRSPTVGLIGMMIGGGLVAASLMAPRPPKTIVERVIQKRVEVMDSAAVDGRLAAVVAAYCGDAGRDAG